MASAFSENHGLLKLLKDGHEVDLTLYDETYAYVKGFAAQQNIAQVRSKTIKRKGNYRPTVDVLSSKSKLLSRQIRSVQSMHGDRESDNFRFKADRYPYDGLGY